MAARWTWPGPECIWYREVTEVAEPPAPSSRPLSLLLRALRSGESSPDDALLPRAAPSLAPSPSAGVVGFGGTLSVSLRPECDLFSLAEDGRGVFTTGETGGVLELLLPSNDLFVSSGELLLL